MLLGVFGWRGGEGGGGKGGGRESIGELQIFSKASDGIFFGVSRDLLPSFVHMYVMYVCMYLGLGVSN